MSTPIEHIVSVAVIRATSEPVQRAWCSCGWHLRCSLGWQHALDQAREHAILATYRPPVGDRHRPNPCLTAKEGC